MENAHAGIVVTEINVYPVKSCRGISLLSANLVATGLDWDRQWLVINARGRFVTQRQLPKMALIEVSLPIEALDRNSGPLRRHAALCLKAPGMEPLDVPLQPSSPRQKVPASMWEWSGHAFDEGPAASEWFSNFLGKPGTRLVRFDTVGELRSTDPEYASGFKTAFNDGYPILVASRESLDAVNERLPEALPMNRFRPNIVVQGCEAFAEDLWRKFKIADVKFQGVKLCSRCKLTTTNQQTAEVGKEPLVVLKTFRVGQALSPAPQMKGQVFFGQNAICEMANGSIKIGDVVQVLQTATSVTELMNKGGA